MNGGISIIDYGINNLKSVSKAFEKIGKSPQIVDKPEDIQSSKCLVLPGIGAFGDGMEELKKRKLIEPLLQKIKEGVPTLGICLGMQMLFTESQEFGTNKGLNLIPGIVVSFKSPAEVRIPNYKIPHIGWNSLKKSTVSWDNTMLRDINEEDEFYFVHSFYPIVKNNSHILANTNYGDQQFCSVVKKANIMGTQFHPEKSGEVGLSILKAFCEVNKI